MKNLLFMLALVLITSFQAQTVKSKNLKIKYTPPAGWNTEEFGGKSPWEDAGNTMCRCAGVHFFKTSKDGKMHVVLYPSSQSGLDSAKRNGVSNLVFEDVQKVDKVRNNGMSMERKKSNFTDVKTKTKSFEAYKYFTKVEDHFFIIYAWQENMQALNSSNEKEVMQMVNAIEPL
jgi:hypothetical protein